MDSDAEMPAPLRVTVCGLPVALSVMVMAAVRLPAAPGMNLTLMVQLAPAATELPQVLLWANSLLLVPVMAMLETFSAPAPLLARVTVCAVAATPTLVVLNVKLAGLKPTVGEGAEPVPLRLIVCGLAGALSVMLIEAVRLPAAPGVKVTLMVQLAPAATELPQLSVSAKSPVLVPVMAMLETFSAPAPLLVRVTVCAVAATPTLVVLNVKLAGLKPTVGEGAEPVPLRLIVCGLAGAWSVMLIEAVRLPAAPGVKVILMVQLAPAATELPQVLLWANSLLLVPVMAMLETFSAPAPLLVRVTVCAVAATPTLVVLNVKLAGLKPTVGEGAEPVPLRLIVCGLAGALSVMLIEAVRLPAAPGVKVTLMVQLAPAATELPQLSVSAKSPVLVPVMAMLETFSAPAPLLVRVTVCAVAATPTLVVLNVKLAGLKPTVGEGAEPVPLRLIVCGLAGALSVMLIEAVRLPAAPGVKVTLMVQFAPAATELPQLSVSAKSPVLVPVMAMLETFSAPAPLLVRVTVCAVDATPTLVVLNVKLA